MAATDQSKFNTKSSKLIVNAKKRGQFRTTQYIIQTELRQGELVMTINER